MGAASETFRSLKLGGSLTTPPNPPIIGAPASRRRSRNQNLVLLKGEKTGTFYVSTSICVRMISPRLASSPNREAIEGEVRRGAPSRLRKNYCGTVEIQWSARLGQTRSVWSIWLVSCNQTNQTDRTYQMDKICRRTSIDSEESDLACRCFAQIQHSTLMFRVQLCPFYVVEMSH